MDATAARSGRGIWEGLYRVLMRRNSIYVTFVVAGAFVGERMVDYGVHRLWEHNNVGSSFCIFGAFSSELTLLIFLLFSTIQKRYEDIPVLGQRQSE